VYEPISFKIREVVTGKEIYTLHIEKNKETIEFHESDLSDDIKKRINYWIEDIVDSLTLEASFVYTNRMLNLIEWDEKIINFASDVFIFFFQDLNFSISEKRAKSFSSFIIGEVKKVLHTLKLEEI